MRLRGEGEIGAIVRRAARSTRGAIDKRARRKIAPLVDRRAMRSSDERARWSRPSSIAIASKSLVNRRATRLTSTAIVRRARSSIAPLVDRAAHRTIAPISPPISPSPRDLIFSSAAQSQFDRIWWIFLLGFVSSVNECGIDSLSACL